MDKERELEQLKKEYKEIPIPENGAAGVQAAMARALQKKRLKKRLKYYAAIAAVAVLGIFIMPKEKLRVNMDFAANESMNRGDDAILEDASGGSAPFPENNYGYADSNDSEKEEKGSEALNDTKGKLEIESTTAGAKPEGADNVELKYEMLFAEEKVRLRISEEIKNQLNDADKETKERPALFGISWQDFDCISENQEYYFNKEGKLVIVFRPEDVSAGIGDVIEFIIPDEVWK